MYLGLSFVGFNHSGVGKYPHADPWGREFDDRYYPERKAHAGKPISKSGYKGVLDGIQADQDYLRVLFNLEHGPGRQKCCHLCHVVQWVSTKPENAGDEHNTAANLYTNYGPFEAANTKLD